MDTGRADSLRGQNPYPRHARPHLSCQTHPNFLPPSPTASRGRARGLWPRPDTEARPTRQRHIPRREALRQDALPGSTSWVGGKREVGLVGSCAALASLAEWPQSQPPPPNPSPQQPSTDLGVSQNPDMPGQVERELVSSASPVWCQLGSPSADSALEEAERPFGPYSTQESHSWSSLNL